MSEFITEGSSISICPHARFRVGRDHAQSVESLNPTIPARDLGDGHATDTARKWIHDTLDQGGRQRSINDVPAFGEHLDPGVGGSRLRRDNHRCVVLGRACRRYSHAFSAEVRADTGRGRATRRRPHVSVCPSSRQVRYSSEQSSSIPSTSVAYIQRTPSSRRSNS